jgi:microcystin-dependent protein
MPNHNHLLQASGATATGTPAANSEFAASASVPVYRSGTPTTTLNPASIAFTGNTQPHTNLQPSLTVNFCIALIGIFPSRN